MNLLLHQGWIGGLGQLIGGDFIVLYAAGQIYRTDTAMIYDYTEQFRVQQSLVEPTTLRGLNPFINPPYVAMVYSLLTFLPMPWSMIVWTFLTIIFCFASVHLIAPLIPNKLRKAGLTDKQLLIIMLSFFPFIEGLLAGQNHGLTLLLVTGILVAAFHQRWLLAGYLAGALIYKPQLILGLIVIWVVQKNIKAIAGFSVIAALWIGSFLLVNGISPIYSYLQASRFLLSLPYADGFPGYIILTLYGLLTSILPETLAQTLQIISQILLLLAAGLVAGLAYRQRNINQLPIMALGLVFPLTFSPYVQLHDLLLVVPIFIIWASDENTNAVFSTAIITYLGAFLLTLFAVITDIAWVAFITIFIFVKILLWNFSLLRSKEHATFN